MTFDFERLRTRLMFQTFLSACTKHWRCCSQSFCHRGTDFKALRQVTFKRLCVAGVRSFIFRCRAISFEFQATCSSHSTEKYVETTKKMSCVLRKPQRMCGDASSWREKMQVGCTGTTPHQYCFRPVVVWIYEAVFLWNGFSPRIRRLFLWTKFSFKPNKSKHHANKLHCQQAANKAIYCVKNVPKILTQTQHGQWGFSFLWKIHNTDPCSKHSSILNEHNSKM